MYQLPLRDTESLTRDTESPNRHSVSQAKIKTDRIDLSAGVNDIGFHEWSNGIQLTFNGANGNPQFQITIDNNGIGFYKDGTWQWAK